MAITHAMIAAAGTSLILGTAKPMALGLAVIGSQLPDIDTTSSLIGQVFFPVSNWIENHFPHRSITHSLLATAAIAALALPVGYFLGDIWTAIALPLGHLLSCFSDSFTKQGVQLFWPDPAWAISVSNPNRRLTTGSTAEYSVLVAATALLIVGIWFAIGGGAVQQFSQQLGLKDGILAVYNQNANTNHVWANIKGVKASDRSPVSGTYFILGTAGSEFVVTDGNGVYKTNEQIVTSKLTTKVGEPATTKIQTIAFDDDDVVPALQQLAANHPGAAIFISGSLGVDLPDDIKPQFSPDHFPTITVTGATVKMDYHPISQAIAHLNNQYAIGTITAKIIKPRPIYESE